MKILLVLTSAILLNNGPQIADPKPHVEAMKKLAFLEGKWKGEGWLEMVPGQKRTFEQTEHVEFRQKNTIMTIVGQGKDKATAESAHDAFGVISFDPAAEKYSMTSWAYPGRQGRFDIKLDGTGFEWGMKNGPATIRYRMKLTSDGTWNETGEMTMDGQTWRKFIEFNVKKVK